MCAQFEDLLRIFTRSFYEKMGQVGIGMILFALSIRVFSFKTYKYFQVFKVFRLVLLFVDAF